MIPVPAMSIVLAGLAVVSGAGKLARHQLQVEVMQRVGVPLDRMWLLATAELAGAAGLIVGLWWWPIGVAAAAGLTLYFIGAVLAHLRVRDHSIGTALAMLVLSAATLALRVYTR